jgi:hypothetical protein
MSVVVVHSFRRFRDGRGISDVQVKRFDGAKALELYGCSVGLCGVSRRQQDSEPSACQLPADFEPNAAICSGYECDVRRSVSYVGSHSNLQPGST